MSPKPDGAGNDGEQNDWTRRLQSIADRRAAKAASDRKPTKGGAGAASLHGGKRAGGKREQLAPTLTPAVRSPASRLFATNYPMNTNFLLKLSRGCTTARLPA